MHWPPLDHDASAQFEGFMRPTSRFVASCLDEVFDVSGALNML